MAFPSLHGADGPLDEIVSVALFIIIIGAVMAMAICPGRSGRRK